jgi:hypothetical protein
MATAIAVVALTSCYNPNGTPDNTATGALTGGAFGAATGAIIGSASRNAGAGALIGGAAGAILGGLFGHAADEEQEARLRQQYPDTYTRAQQGAPLSLADIKALYRAGIKDDIIVAQISNSHTVYHLSANDIIDLHDAGVSQGVIDFMINTASSISGATTSVVMDAPPPVPLMEPVVPSPGPGYVWANGEWVWNNGWYWSTGYWLWPPFPGTVWVGGYWGPGPHGYVRFGGHWRR